VCAERARERETERERERELICANLVSRNGTSIAGGSRALLGARCRVSGSLHLVDIPWFRVAALLEREYKLSCAVTAVAGQEVSRKIKNLLAHVISGESELKFAQLQQLRHETAETGETDRNCCY
jgi:hypothetical protein